MQHLGWTCKLKSNSSWIRLSHHHIVIHVPHVIDVHGDLGSAAVAPWGAGRRHWPLTWLAAWREFEVGTVWFAVYVVKEELIIQNEHFIRDCL